MKKSELKYIINIQRETLDNRPFGLPREYVKHLQVQQSHALIIAGIRRCGKSTLLYQFMRNQVGNGVFTDFLHLNFDDFRLLGFTSQDFKLLEEIIREKETTVLFFDEIQLVQGWETYIKMKLDQGFTVGITGSNATLLSRELGTRLTGRHITKELFPFSYGEFLKFKSLGPNTDSLDTYLFHGGFPEYIKSDNPEVLTNLIIDILYRDIAIRYGLRDVLGLEKLFAYLVSHVGTLLSPSSLTSIVGIKSPSTILDYLSYFSSSYLMDVVPRFAHSLKAQSVAPKKIYVLDQGLVTIARSSSSRNLGRLLENFIYTHLRRGTHKIYYAGDSAWECDFVVNPTEPKNIQLIQVCWELTSENEEWEIRGLRRAMELFALKKGTIITHNQSDSIMLEDSEISVVPAWEFVTNQQNTSWIPSR